MTVDINIWAVLVCGVVSMFLGAMWYGPLFQNPWMKAHKFTAENMKANQKIGMNAAYAINFVAALLTAYVFAHVLATYEADSLSLGFQGAFWMWLGFIATTQVGKVLWEQKPWSLWAIDAGYYAVLFLINSAILVSWK